MGLEHWDSSRRKYVLYQNTEQHNDDCNRFPFESIPRRVFLDTNVINVLVKHSTHVFEQEPIPPNTEPTLAVDIEALMHVFYVGARADWTLVGSQKTRWMSSHAQETARSAMIFLSTRLGSLIEISMTRIAGSPRISDGG